MIAFASVPTKMTNHPAAETALEPAVPLKVAIVYDGVSSGRRAVSTMQRMIAQSGEPTHLMPSLWRFDLLQDSTCRSHATTDAVDSDLLILATDQPDALPAQVEEWLADFLARRRGTPVTILAMGGLEDEWSVSLLERNAAGRLLPIHAPDSRPATMAQLHATLRESPAAA